MKAIMVMFDSLNRRMLPPYGCDWVHAPNFNRLVEKAVTFDNAYGGSLPCMPARRELHTGRYNFLHASWGPIEPYDDSMPEILSKNGIYTHMVSDHYHYWEDGGCTYHTRYSSWECSRGQEGDPWKGEVGDVDIPESLNNNRIGNPGSPTTRQDWINRGYMRREEDFSQAKTFAMGLEFMEKNHIHDNWFLQIENFDPHEPFFSHSRYKGLYSHDYKGSHFDWPSYQRVGEPPEVVDHVRYEYAALLSMCDNYLGKVLDMMDKHDMWKDTMLIVNTDHGYMLGEHGWWAKCVMPFYNEVAHIPLFIWDPRSGIKEERRKALVQTIDIAPTILDFFNVAIPQDMQGMPLRGVIENDRTVREAALFGIFGGHVNITDGRYVYMRGPEKEENSPLYEYKLMPTQHGARSAFIETERLRHAQMVQPFSHTKGCPVMKIPGKTQAYNAFQFGSLLFDLENDPGQGKPINDPAVEKRMTDMMVGLMKRNDCPPEQFERLGIT